MSSLVSHPAVQFANWLRCARQLRGIVKRVFAGQISLSASEYTEVEAGVVRWIEPKQEKLIPEVLDLSKSELKDFRVMLSKAREAIQLTFDKVFTREHLAPVRLRSDNNRQLTIAEREILLNAVFTPLPQ